MAAVKEQLLYVAIGKVVPAKDNPRQSVGDVDELAASIGALGILEPLVCTNGGDRYQVVAGARRLAAAKKAGLAEVPVIVRELTEEQRQEAMLIENLQRSDLSPLEEAKAFKRLLDLDGYSQRKLAERIGRSQSHISKRLALLELPAKVTKLLDSGGITLEDAQEISKLVAMPERIDEALKRKTHHGGIARAVRDELADHQADVERAALIAKLRADGVDVVEIDRNGYMEPKPPKGYAVVREYAYSGDVKMPPARHAKLACHAVGIDYLDRQVELCSKPSDHREEKSEISTDAKAIAAEERQRERAKLLRAWEQNVELGDALRDALAAPKITEPAMRAIAELVLVYAGEDLGQRGLRLTDPEAQTIVRKKDETISRVTHVDTVTECRAILRRRLDEATTAEQIMGVLLQAIAAARYGSMDALPGSRRFGSLRGLGAWGSTDKVASLIEQIAGPHVPKASAKRKRS